MSASGLKKPAPRLFLMAGFRSRLLKLKPLWRKQKDDVQTWNEGFPRIWFRENLTPPDRTGGEITPKMLNELEEQGALGQRVFYPRRREGSEKEVGEGGGDAAGCKSRAGSEWMALEEH